MSQAQINRNKTSPKAVQRRLRDKQILELRRRGVTEEQIAKNYGIGRSRVSQIIKAELEALPVYKAGDLRKLNATRLNKVWLWFQDYLKAAVLSRPCPHCKAPIDWPAEEAPAAARAAVAMLRREAALWGLDAPIKVEQEKKPPEEQVTEAMLLRLTVDERDMLIWLQDKARGANQGARTGPEPGQS